MNKSVSEIYNTSAIWQVIRENFSLKKKISRNYGSEL